MKTSKSLPLNARPVTAEPNGYALQPWYEVENVSSKSLQTSAHLPLSDR